MNRRRFLQILGLATAMPAAVARLHDWSRNPGLRQPPPSTPLVLPPGEYKISAVGPVVVRWQATVTADGSIEDHYDLSNGLHLIVPLNFQEYDVINRMRGAAWEGTFPVHLVRTHPHLFRDVYTLDICGNPDSVAPYVRGLV